MRIRHALLPSLALLGLGAQAQDVKISGLIQIWQTQMLDSNLRLNSSSIAPNKYYTLGSQFVENTTTMRRAEIKFSGEVIKDLVAWEVMVDPTISTSSSNPTILQDMALIYKPIKGVEFKIGQYKNLQTLESGTSSSELLFAERGQIALRIGEKRDRGATLSYTFGDKKSLHGKLALGVFQGMCEVTSGKSNDVNAQKDLAFRAELGVGANHRFGFYGLQGSTDQADKGALVAQSFAGNGVPTGTAILDNKDKTTDMGVFYVFQNKSLYMSLEGASGLLGRRTPSLGSATGSAKREHLDQQFMGFSGTLAYTFGAHTLAGRFDHMNYNQGDKWYTATNPYTTDVKTGKSTGLDFTPKYTEITAGYTYAFKPEKVKAANIKLNYIARSKNFLKPRADQSGEQGGDSLVMAFQVAF